jgi:bacillithiol biosynthesis cysteine-adding enzyme BshC
MTQLARVATARESNAAAASAGLWAVLDTIECGHPEIVEAFCAGLPAAGAIVDVGCWNGSVAALVARSIGNGAEAPWRSYTAVDCVDEAVECFRAAHAQRPRTQALQGDVRALPLVDASADVVLCLFVLQDLEGYRTDGEQALAELARVARPGASMLLGLTVQTRGEEETHYVVKKLRRNGIPEKPTHHWFGPDFLAAVRASGFRITALDGFGPNERGFVELYVRAVREGDGERRTPTPAAAVGPLPGTPPLASAYTGDFDRVFELFEHDYREPASFDRAAATAAARAVPRDELATLLATQQNRFDAGAAARNNVERLRAVDTVAVVTGQQPALFGGPLYNLLKAATAVGLAHDLEARSGRAHVPVFWIANDDHALSDLDHVHAVGPDGSVTRIAWEHGRDRDTEPVSAIRLDAGVTRALDALGPGAQDARELLADTFRPGELLSDCFGRLLARLFEGLVVVDPADARVRQLGMPALAAELDFPSPSTEAAAVATARVAELGFRPQVTLRADRLNLFHGRSQRFRVRAAADGFRIDHDGRRVDRDALCARFASAPEEFSPNVLLRPLYQDALFATAAYVAGPSETAYFAQLRPVYERFGVPMPVIYPRRSATLVDASRAAALRAAGLGVDDVLRDVGALGAEAYAADPLHASLVPLGRPQERVLGAASALLEHGLALIGELLAVVRSDGFEHAVVSVGDGHA